MKYNKGDIPLYDGPNGKMSFIAWKKKMHTLILGAGVGDALLPAWPLPQLDDTPLDIKKLERNRIIQVNEARSLLLLGLSESQQMLVNFSPTTLPSDLWKLLADTHGTNSQASSRELQIRFNDCPFDFEDTVASYVAKLKDLIEQLGAAGVVVNMDALLSKLHGVLVHIPYYKAILIAYDLRLEENKSLTELLALFHRYETNYPKITVAASAASQQALVALPPVLAPAPTAQAPTAQVTNNSQQQSQQQRGQRSNQHNRSTIVCDFCNKKGHHVEDCFALIKAKKYCSSDNASDRRLDRRQNSAPYNNRRGSGSVWCEYHNTTSHSSADCRSTSGSSSQQMVRFADNRSNRSNSPPARHYNSNNHHGAFMGRVTSLSSCTSSDSTSESNIIFDSGCSSHMSPLFEFFYNYALLTPPVTIGWGNESSSSAIGVGDIAFESTVDGLTKSGYFHDVYYVPALGKMTLISLSKLEDKGYNFVNPAPGVVNITREDGVTLIQCFRRHNLYHMNVTFSPSIDTRVDNFTSKVLAFTASNSSTTTLWHHRLGHYSLPIIKDSLKTLDVNITSMDFCPTCPLAKQTRLLFNRRNTRSPVVLNIIHMDLCGPFPESIARNKYFFTLTDDFSRFSTLYFIHSKSEVFHCFQIYHAHVTTLHGLPIKAVQTDNGGEFWNGKLDDFCQSLGILQRFTTAHTPQSNGVAERLNRSLLNISRSLMLSVVVKRSLWAEAVAAAAHIRNMLQTSTSQGKLIPWTLWFNKPPPLQQLRVWGCPTYVKTLTYVKKFEPRATKGMLVGYANSESAYRVFLPSTNKVVISRDVTFNEDAVINSHVHGTSSNTEPCFVDEFLSDSDSSEDELVPVPPSRPQTRSMVKRKHSEDILQTSDNSRDISDESFMGVTPILTDVVGFTNNPPGSKVSLHNTLN